MIREKARELSKRVMSQIFAQRCVVAGSLRRNKPRIGDIDIIVVRPLKGEIPLSIFTKIVNRGASKITGMIDDMQIDLRICDVEELGSHLLYFTGSKDHNIATRSLAKSLGLELNEHGLFTKSKTLLARETESDIYSALGLLWIPPELRFSRHIDFERCMVRCLHCGEPCLKVQGHSHRHETGPKKHFLTGHDFL